MKLSFYFLFVPLFAVLHPVSVATLSPTGKKSKIPFSKSLPEDISNENFPEIINSFDYNNTPLIDLIKAMGKLTGLNFIIDPGVSNKKITIIAPSKITVAEAYQAFLSALAINGYTVVKSGAFWKIRETKKALKDNTEIYSGGYFPNTDQLITRIIKLRHINGKEFAGSIKHLLSDGNRVSQYESSNSILISDYGSVIERVMKLVKVLDVPGSEESVKVIPIRHAAATDLAGILNELLSTGKRASPRFSPRNRKGATLSVKASKRPAGNIKISHIIADERTNSLVVSANTNGIKRVKDLVKKLDTYVDPSRTGGIYVYNVLYGTAEQVYNTLMGISPSKAKPARAPRTYGFGSKKSIGPSSRLPSSTSPLFQNVTIMADPNTNSLIISARNKYDFEKVKAVLKKIDVPRDQVFVQAAIVEMSVGDNDVWEINLARQIMKGVGDTLKNNVGKVLGFDEEDEDSVNSMVGGFLNKGLSASPDTIKNLSFGPGFVLGLPLSKILRNIGVGANFSEGDKTADELSRELYGQDFKDLSTESQREEIIGLRRSQISSSNNRLLNQAVNSSILPLLQILKKAGNVNILSTPQITALDNVKAVIEVGEKAPVGLSNTATVGTGVINSVDREDVTLKLEITPRINPDSNTVQMDILQKFDDFSTKQSAAGELQKRGVHIIKRNIETKLVLHDGETAVLGGLMTDKEVKNENKVPFLGDIPVLGWLFKGSDVKKEKRNLIVFITPTIIRGEDQRSQTRQLLGKKLEERIHFIKKYMKGEDPHGEFLKKLTSKRNAPSEKTAPPADTFLQKSEPAEWMEDSETAPDENIPETLFEDSQDVLPPEEEDIGDDETSSAETVEDEETTSTDETNENSPGES